MVQELGLCHGINRAKAANCKRQLVLDVVVVHADRSRVHHAVQGKFRGGPKVAATGVELGQYIALVEEQVGSLILAVQAPAIEHDAHNRAVVLVLRFLRVVLAGKVLDVPV